MDPVLEEIYSTIIPSAPYVIAAYALVWLALFIYVMIMRRSTKRAEARIEVLEEALAERESRDGEETAEMAEPAKAEDAAGEV